MHLPTDVAADDSGNIYIADGSNARIRKVNRLGIISTFAGNGTGAYIGDGMPATAAQFSPLFIKIDTFGNFYISDELNYRVLKIDSVGIFHCVAGDGVMTNTGDNGPATAASIYYPSGISVDGCKNLFISDVNNSEVREVNFNPICAIALNATNLNLGSKISIYPNPVYHELIIKSDKKISNVRIINLFGQIVYTGNYDNENVEIDISQLPTGVHIAIVTDIDGDVNIRKVFKE